jgi:thiol:disulfide interchange protein/DsbC/DsbD-like thiol-disulfide interchange protein
MSQFLGLLLFLLSCSPGFAARTEHVEAELIAENGSLRSGEEAWIGLRLVTQKHWHVYWKSPGDSGLPTKVQWQLPPGWEISEPYWQIPQRIVLYPLVNYGYEGESLIGFRLKVPARDVGKKEIQAKASWLVCKEECIPEKADLKLNIEILKQEPKRNSWATAFDLLRMQQPAAVPKGEAAMLSHDQKAFTLELSNQSSWLGKKRDFFPYAAQQITGLEEPKSKKRKPDGFYLRMDKADPIDSSLKRFAGMLVVDGSRAYNLDLAIPELMSESSPNPQMDSLWITLFFALLGGLVLNLMPCVFPVLGMKALSLVRLSGSERKEARRAGLAYTFGILVSFWALSILLFAFRSAGVAAGWGFQLQSPLFVISLTLLFILMAWNMLGVFEVGGRWTGIGSSLANKEGAAGSFFTGVLAVLVASPCTAPFMGAAIAAVITAPLSIVLAVFTCLGLGLAFPFLLLSFVPSLQKAMPRPGAWMDTFKKILAFPLFATSLWLLWVFQQQVGANGLLLALIAAFILSIGVWVRYQWRERKWSFYAMLAFFLLSTLVAFQSTKNVLSAEKEIKSEGNWVSYEENSLHSSLNEGRAVFIDFTAAWCLSCQVNKRVVLETDDMQDFFRKKNVLLMRADFTNEDPKIARALAGYNSVSVPLYVVYAANSPKPRILNSILTKSMVRNAFEGKGEMK